MLDDDLFLFLSDALELILIADGFFGGVGKTEALEVGGSVVDILDN